MPSVIFTNEGKTIETVTGTNLRKLAKKMEFRFIADLMFF